MLFSTLWCAVWECAYATASKIKRKKEKENINWQTGNTVTSSNMSCQEKLCHEILHEILFHCGLGCIFVHLSSYHRFEHKIVVVFKITLFKLFRFQSINYITATIILLQIASKRFRLLQTGVESVISISQNTMEQIIGSWCGAAAPAVPCKCAIKVTGKQEICLLIYNCAPSLTVTMATS